MVQYPVRSGVDTFAVYKEEVVFDTDPGTWTANAAHFGLDQSITPSLTRNLIKSRADSGLLPSTNDEVTSRDAVQIHSGKFEVGLDVEFQPQEFSFLKLVFGSVSTVSTTYNYPQATASTEADKKKYLKIPSISTAMRYDFGGTGEAIDKVWVLSGLKVNTFNMNAAKEEPVSCSLNFVGASIKGDETDIATNYPYVALSAEDIYTFAHADVTYAGATPIANIIDGFDLTVENTAEGLSGLNAYTNKAVVIKDRNFTVKLDLTSEGKTFMDDFIGSTTTVGASVVIDELRLVLNKGGNKNLTVYLKDLYIGDGGIPMALGEIAKESITLEAKYAYCVENATL